VNLADEIAYTGHDCEDGLRAELFSVADIRKIAFVDQAMIRATPRGTALRGAIIHMLVTDLLTTTQKMISDQSIRTLDDVHGCKKPLAQFSKSTHDALKEVRDFLWDKMYLHPAVQSKSHEGQVIIDQLCEQYMITPDQRIHELMKKNLSALPEAIKDYVSGMTDAYAKSSAA
jgi:dGTPase